MLVRCVGIPLYCFVIENGFGHGQAVATYVMLQ